MARAYRAALVVAGVGTLAACAMLSSPVPAPPREAPPAAPAAPAPLLQPAARWLPADWSELPGWSSDRTLDAWSALRRSCERTQRMTADTQRAWQGVCADALRATPVDDAAARSWLEQRLRPYRVLPIDANASADGLATGYFEPQLDASRTPRGTMRVPLWSPPADLATRKPWYTRGEIDTLPAAQAALRGREIAHVADPLDALLLQVQGSGRLRVTEPDGRVQTVRLAYAGTNDHGYVSVGRWLIDQGQLKAGEASWPAIRDWARRNPQRVPQMLAANPRVVFFREEPLPDPTQGPRGSLGVALTPERSVAVDPTAVPLGSALWIDTSEPLSATPLRRLVLAQDTGSAITGAVRIDYFWGTGERAQAQAGRMKQPLRVWVLWPRG
jgi:membrane-bound lytic murein transglycosylase A